MPGKHYDLDINNKLGGTNASDITIASQKAVKSYVDTEVGKKQDALTQGENITIKDGVISAKDTDKLADQADVAIENIANGQGLIYNSQTKKWENSDIVLETTWGEINGNLLDQEDLKDALNNKMDKVTLADVATSGSYNDLEDKPTIPVVVDTYSATSSNGMSGKAVASAIENKANKATSLEGYGITDAYTKTQIDGMMTSVYVFQGSVPTKADLPKTSTKGFVYNVEEDNMNYAWDGKAWDPLGSTIDLSGYLLKTTADSTYSKLGHGHTATEVSGLASVATSGSYNDLTNKPTIDTALSDASSNAVENKVIKSALDEKQPNLSQNQIIATNSGITSTKVEGYDSHISDTTSHVTSTDKTNWNAKQSALSTEQLAATNSGITSDKVGGYDSHLSNADIHVTSEQKTEWSGKQAALNTNQMNAVNSGVTSTKISGYDTHLSNTEIHVTAANKTTWNAKQDALTEAQLNAADSGITSAKVTKYDGYETTINNKADKATTLAGYGITNAYTKDDVDAKLSSVYKYKGSVANYAALPTSGQVVGDVYNVEAADSTHKIKAGDNVAWNGSAWDVLAGTVDLSAYVKTEDANKNYAAKTHGHAASEVTGLSKVATSNSYTDLDNKPTIPTVDTTLNASSTNAISNAAVTSALNGKAASTHSHEASEVNGLATVATSGSYTDLSNKPTIDTAISGTSTNAVQNKIIKGELDKKQGNLSATQLNATNSGITSTKVTSYDEHIADDDIHVTADDKTTWSGKQNALNQNQINATNSGITSTKVTSYDNHIADTTKHITSAERTAWNAKMDAVTLADVATSGDYNDLSNTPTVDATLSATSTNAIQNKAVQSALNNKQDAINDLATIRTNATAGANAATTIAGYGNIVSHNASEFLTEHNPVDATLSNISTNAVQNKAVKDALDLKADATAIPTNYVPNTRTVNGKALSSNITLGASDVSAVPTSRTVNGKALSSNITLSASDVGATTMAAVEAKGYLTEHQSLANYYNKTEIDGKLTGAMHFKGTVDKVASLPTGASVGDMYNVKSTGANYAWDGTAWDKLSENIDLSGVVPTTRTVNGKALSADITLSASDVGATTMSAVEAKGYLVASDIAGKANDADLATVAKSGSYNDLGDKPSIPTITDTYSATSSNGMSGKAVASAISNKMDKVTLASVATSGNYNDLSNKPTIPSAVTETTVSGWGFTKNTGTLTGVKMNGSAKTVTNGVVDLGTVITAHQDISGKANSADLATVATSGSYNDLEDKPTIPSQVTESTVSGWGFTKNTGSYSKPTGGIPKTDLASGVQTSLGKADTALQGITSSDVTTALGFTPYNSTNPNGYTSNTGTITGIKMNGASKGTSGVVDLGTVITAHQDISGKSDVGHTHEAGDVSGLATVATTGAYSDLSGKPTIPTITDTYSATSGNGMSGKAVASAISGKANSATTLAGYGITDAYTKTEVDNKVSSVYKYKGSKSTYAQLPTTGNVTGDVWNVETADATHGIKAGDNVAWTGTAWDVLAGTVDLSAYAKTADLKTVATSGSYNDLTDKPTIPSAVTESTVSGWGFTKNTGTYSKPSTGIPKTDLASAVQTSLGKADSALQGITSSDVTTALGFTPYNATNPNGYTSNVGTITGATMNGKSVSATNGVLALGTVITSHQDISGKANTADLAPVATSGSYNDLSDKPTIPSAVTESTVSGWGFTKNTGTYSKPSTGIPKTDLASAVQTSLGKADTALQSHQDISGKADVGHTHSASDITSGLATVATSGSYNDLSNKPTIPAAVTETTVSGWGFTKNAGTVTSVNNVAPVNGNVTLTIPSAVTESTVSGWGFTKNAGTVTKVNNIAPVNGNVTLTIPSAVTESTVSGWGFTKNAGTLTGVKMNGAAKTVTNGVVDLGTVITAHQDISGKANTNHNQASSTITAMTSYSKATAKAAIATTDSLNTAIGKLEYKIDNVPGVSGGITVSMLSGS